MDTIKKNIDELKKIKSDLEETHPDDKSAIKSLNKHFLKIYKNLQELIKNSNNKTEIRKQLKELKMDVEITINVMKRSINPLSSIRIYDKERQKSSLKNPFIAILPDEPRKLK